MYIHLYTPGVPFSLTFNLALLYCWALLSQTMSALGVPLACFRFISFCDPPRLPAYSLMFGFPRYFASCVASALAACLLTFFLSTGLIVAYFSKNSWLHQGSSEHVLFLEAVFHICSIVPNIKITLFLRDSFLL